MKQKRGLFFVALVLSLLLFVSSVLALESYTGFYHIPTPQCDDSCTSSRLSASVCNNLATAVVPNCGVEIYENYLEGGGINGCNAYIAEYDFGPFDDNDRAQAELPSGTIFDSNYKNYWSDQVSFIFGEGDDGADVIRTALFRADVGKSYLCKRDVDNFYYWYTCDSSDDVGQTLDVTVNEGGNDVAKTFICLSSVNGFTWQDISNIDASADTDQDGVPDTLDCAADNGEIHGSFPMGCAGENGETCVQAVPELCGDQVDNDCDGSIDNCGNSKVVCENQINGLSWVDGVTNNCCGDNPREDVGFIATNGAVNGEQDDYICLSSDEQYTGYAGTGIASIQGWNENRCTSNWCWIRASGNSQFQIFTIKKPAESLTPGLYDEVYDVVSNSNQWLECKATEGSLGISENLADGNDIRNANRFYCYQEGNSGRWAECVEDSASENPTNGIKVRTVGQGPFSLFSNEGEDSSHLINFDGDFSGEAMADLDGYQYLEFMLRFSALRARPATVTVSALTEDNQLLWSMSALGYATNTPLLEENQWLHLELPLPQQFSRLQNIAHLKFESTSEQNIFSVRNIFLSRGESSPICSGRTSATAGKSSWLSDIDSYDFPISGEEICDSFYGSLDAQTQSTGKAWLGNDVPEQRNCCGDDMGEYYSGPSGSDLACWNSLTLSEGDIVTNVVFDIQYNLVSDFSEITLSPSITFNYLNGFTGSSVNSVTITDQTSPLRLGRYIIDKNQLRAEESPEIVDTLFYRLILTTPEQPVRLYYIDAATGQELGDIFYVRDLPADVTTIHVMAELTEPLGVVETLPEPLRETVEYTCVEDQCLYALPGSPPYQITNLHPGLYDLYFVSGNTDQEQILISQTDQLFEVAGNILVKKVSRQVIFDVEKEEDGTYIDSGFYGCNAPDYLVSSLTGVENQPFCSIKAGKFCSYSSEEGINSWSDDPLEEVRGVSTVGGESEGLQLIDFTSSNLLKSDTSRTTPFEPKKRTQSTTAVPGRNLLQNPTFAGDGADVDGWEIMSPESSEYSYVQKENTEGTLSLYAGVVVKSEKIAVPGGVRMRLTQEAQCDNIVVHLVNKDGIISDLLPSDVLDNVLDTSVIEEIGPDGIAGRAASSSSDPTVQPESSADIPLVEQRLGVSSTGIVIDLSKSLPEFITDIDTSYLVVEYTGVNRFSTLFSSACDIKNPVLQIIDSKGPAEFNDVEPNLPHSGAACCPANYCWNGYSCVEPMGSYTSISENIEEGRDYRCIAGVWQAQAMKSNWKGLQSGFCPQETQCFVMSSTSGIASSQNTAASFYTGDYPTCVNSNEYIFDNYCDQGNWSSRTKVLAAKLLDAGESSGDYTVYCTDYESALPYIPDASYLRGLEPATGVAENPGAQQRNICFPGIDDDSGKSLISNNENTCINNVCLLIKDGNVIFATTLNDPSGEGAFLNALGGQPQNLQQCSGDFVDCNIGLSGTTYYSSTLKAIIYDKNNEGLGTSAVDTVLGFFRDLFTRSSAISPEEVLPDIENFREVYSLKKGSKRVLAVQEIKLGQTKLIAVYDDFETPICDYADMDKIADPDLRNSLPSPEGLALTCTQNGTIHRVEAIAGLDFLWSELTGKLRVEE